MQAVHRAPSRALARDLAKGVTEDFGRDLPSAVACIEACIAELGMPVAHCGAIRTTNLLEPLFVEEHRRLKITPNPFCGRLVLKPMCGAMSRAAERWRRIRFTEFERRPAGARRRIRGRRYQPARLSAGPPRHRTLQQLSEWTGLGANVLRNTGCCSIS